MNYKNLFVGVDIGGTKISIVFFKRNKIIIFLLMLELFILLNHLIKLREN